MAEWPGQEVATNDAASRARHGRAIVYARPALRLSLREWIVAGLLAGVALWLLPRLWPRVEPLPVGPDERVPYEWSSDYWLFQRYAGGAVGRGEVLLLGDSVIWGRYVPADQALSRCLEARADGPRFANLGVNGMHPAALAGLLEHYGQPISNATVIVHCNLLWFSSAEHDLQVAERTAFNHPALIPQFHPRIPAYDAPLSERLGVIVDRHLVFRSWSEHLRWRYLEGQGLAGWTLEHPYANPLQASLPTSHSQPAGGARLLAAKANPPWLDLEESLQWRSFLEAIEILQRRHNRVFVLIGPFNEWMLTSESRRSCRRVRDAVAAALQERNIPHYAPPIPPAERFADASHLVAEGHAWLAEQMLGQEAFGRFLAEP